MIRKLVLVRHGEAGPRRLGATDAQRELTKRGRLALEEAYPRVFAPLVRESDDIQVWSSEATRARQTAEVVCAALGLAPEAIELHRTLYSQDEDTFFGELSVMEGIVVAVGHIPFMDNVASDLAHRSLSFSPGAVACFDVPDRGVYRSKLAWFAQGSMR
jgi:phosphohistidine phosphatase